MHPPRPTPDGFPPELCPGNSLKHRAASFLPPVTVGHKDPAPVLCSGSLLQPGARQLMSNFQVE